MTENSDGYLFDLSQIPQGEKVLELKKAEVPVWTENKASLIQRYLRYFVFITKHGTYLDAFAAPQSVEHAHVSCAAKLVLESEPKWLRNFALFDKSKAGVAFLESLKASDQRNISVIAGDSNETLPRYLDSNPVPDKEATFCLLDQRTFECDWSTVQAVSNHKRGGNKIELFYFLAHGWLDRAFSGLKRDPEGDMNRWWGNDSWTELEKLRGQDRGMLLADRFKKELGYRYAYPFPIYERDASGGKVMFYMVHASDHEEAPKQMMRAYRNAVSPLEPIEQLNIEFGIGNDT